MASSVASTSTAAVSIDRFSPAAYLKGLGWKGEGTGLTSAPHARSKPVLVAQKKNFTGVGKDRDTSFPWWEMVFEAAAKKGTGKEVKTHTTSTGILSPLPPPPDRPAQTKFDILADAKMEAARRQLYAMFLRGQDGLKGSLEEEIAEEEARNASMKQKKKEKGKGKERKEKREKKRKGLPTPSDSDVDSSSDDKGSRKKRKGVTEDEDKDEKKAAKVAKKEKKRRAAAAAAAEEAEASATPKSGEDEAYEDAMEAARLAEKAERKLAKKQAKAAA